LRASPRAEDYWQKTVAQEAQKESQMPRPLGAVEAEENWENQSLPPPEPAALAR